MYIRHKLQKSTSKGNSTNDDDDDASVPKNLARNKKGRTRKRVDNASKVESQSRTDAAKSRNNDDDNSKKRKKNENKLHEEIVEIELELGKSKMSFLLSKMGRSKMHLIREETMHQDSSSALSKFRIRLKKPKPIITLKFKKDDSYGKLSENEHKSTTNKLEDGSYIKTKETESQAICSPQASALAGCSPFLLPKLPECNNNGNPQERTEDEESPGTVQTTKQPDNMFKSVSDTVSETIDQIFKPFDSMIMGSAFSGEEDCETSSAESWETTSEESWETTSKPPFDLLVFKEKQKDPMASGITESFSTIGTIDTSSMMTESISTFMRK